MSRQDYLKLLLTLQCIINSVDEAEHLGCVLMHSWWSNVLIRNEQSARSPGFSLSYHVLQTESPAETNA